MVKFTSIEESPGWFQEVGANYDVVLSSRARLSRNLSSHRFPMFLESDEESEVQSDILSAFQDIESVSGYDTSLIGDLAPTERRMMMERNYITQQFSLHNHKAAIMRLDQKISGMINEIDHLRISCMKGGLSLVDCWHSLDALDSSLEGTLNYAVSLEWGYLSAEVANTGTGLRASVMLHLPALVRSSIIEKAMKAVVQVGMTVKGFFGNDENSLGDLYQISNQLGLGISEKELIEKLDAIVSQLVHYERKAREELLEKQRTELEDEVMRALGILSHCRLLSASEAIQLLASIRFGAALGLLAAPIERITAMLFLTQKAHIQYLIGSNETGADTKLIDQMRAELVRDTLERCL
ncbi:MAG: hypothetical protein HN368_04825 [Spirochaetales bacterium]|jgi:protein arginine kinase|nr:hypothetical protein [Spirochaetales bacterium]